jgi:hypothetical protein
MDNAEDTVITVTFPVEVRVKCADEGTAEQVASLIMEATEDALKNDLIEIDSEGIFLNLEWDFNKIKFEKTNEPDA